MRDLFKFLIVGIVFLFCGHVYAGDYRVLVIPDNIVTENMTVDSYIYNEAAEFFANGVITLLNTTDNIKSPVISDIRALYKKDPSTYLMTKKLTEKFKTSYNVDTSIVKKLANKAETRYVLLITAYIDHENYILRRTLWDLLNIPGATVVDPAYKISTYAVLFDTKNNAQIWSDTYYKTISICENRIITRGPSPQAEQLEKIRDYSRTLCPQIAQSVQLAVLPSDVLATESKHIFDDMGNFDNVFTKKYRKYIKSTNNKIKRLNKKSDNKKELKSVETRIVQPAEKVTPATKLEVKAQPVIDTKINNTKNNSQSIKTEDENLKKDVDSLYNKSTADYPVNLYKEQNFDIKKTKTNTLINKTNITPPPSIRNYSL